ncbi:MAG: endonuclease/exonuclease/phosphatase family protein [Anaerotignum sp.]|nr:endonuclease/exonuclease/phosphatase family protein [Anaerotignum sp.]
MKLLTLNTHSLQEENARQKLEWFVEGILKEKPDIVALQEVSQTASAPLAEDHLREGQYRIAAQISLRQDNYAAQVAFRLRQAGIDCHWVWLPIKRGYETYDEGIAILSLGRKITKAEMYPVSKSEDYDNWRTRDVLGVQVEGYSDWFYSIHLGWWEDAEDPFLEQWKTLGDRLETQRRQSTVWLMGDFNAPDIFLDQSYTRIRADGWMDTHQAAEQKGKDFTVFGIIDGWRDKLPDQNVSGMRLDYIWCSQEKEIRSSRILFDGENEPVVSDHFGVLIETKEE